MSAGIAEVKRQDVLPLHAARLPGGNVSPRRHPPRSPPRGGGHKPNCTTARIESGMTTSSRRCMSSSLPYSTSGHPSHGALFDADGDGSPARVLQLLSRGIVCGARDAKDLARAGRSSRQRAVLAMRSPSRTCGECLQAARNDRPVATWPQAQAVGYDDYAPQGRRRHHGEAGDFVCLLTVFDEVIFEQQNPTGPL